MRRLAFLLTLLLALPAQAQNVFFPANPGDMIVKGTVGAWTGVPGGTAGCVLMSQGPTVAPTWSCALPLNFALPPMAPNTVWGNMTAAQAPPTAANISQFLNTIDFDIQRPPLPGAVIYKGTDNLWHTAPPATAGWVWTSQGAGAIPQWQLSSLPVANITVGSTIITGGTSNGLLFNNAGVFGNTSSGINSALVTSGAGVPSLAQTLPTAVQNNITQVGTLSSGTIPGALLTGTVAASLLTGTIPNGVQDNITRTGTITSGVWHGTPIAAAYGGFGFDVSASSGVPLFATGTPTFTATTGTGNFIRTTAVREKLVADRTYTLNCGGGADFTTWQSAADTIWQTLDTQEHNVTVNVANCSYSGGITLSGPNVGGGIISFVGNTGTPSSVDINVTGRLFDLSNGATLTVSGVKMRATQENIRVTNGGQLTISAYEHGAAGQHVEVDTGGRFFSNGNYTISGAAGIHLHVNKNAFAYIANGVGNISSIGQNYSFFFFGASQNSSTFFDMFTYAGAGFASVTGQSYFIHSQTMVDLGSGVAEIGFFPGAGGASSILNNGGNLNGVFGNTRFGLGDTPTTVSAHAAASGTAGGAKYVIGDGTTSLGQFGTWSSIFGGAFDATTTLYSGNSMILTSVDGRTGFGRGTAAYVIGVNGTASGTGGGARLIAENSGVARIAMGNFSSVIGGAYDATGTLWTNGPMRLFAGDSSTASCASGLKTDANGQLSCIPSSARFKDNIVDLRGSQIAPEMLIASLRPTSFTLKDDASNSARVGLIAEEVEKVAPSLVFYKDGKPSGVDYSGLTVEILAVVQDQQRRTEYLQAALFLIALLGVIGFAWRTRRTVRRG